jgi:hypothetical protein
MCVANSLGRDGSPFVSPGFEIEPTIKNSECAASIEATEKKSRIHAVTV